MKNFKVIILKFSVVKKCSLPILNVLLLLLFGLLALINICAFTTYAVKFITAIPKRDCNRTNYRMWEIGNRWICHTQPLKRQKDDETNYRRILISLTLRKIMIEHWRQTFNDRWNYTNTQVIVQLYPIHQQDLPFFCLTVADSQKTNTKFTPKRSNMSEMEED